MSAPRPLTVVTVVDDPAELEQNLLRSPFLRDGPHQLVVVDNRGNRAGADMAALYRDAAEDAEHDLTVFAHQDVFFPDDWDARLAAALDDLESRDPDWGVVGSAGVALDGRDYTGHWRDPGGPRRAEALPAEVQVLDELWLGVRRSRGPAFDPAIPGFHCYGADLCLAAREQGRRCWAVDAFAWHKHRLPDGAVVETREQSPKIARRASPEFRAEFAASRERLFAKWEPRLPEAAAALAASVWLEG